MMEYNPAHKTSSITSITSTSTASTWEHPISNDYPSIKPETTTDFEEYPEFDASLISDRIAIPPFEYFDNEQLTTTQTESDFFAMFNQCTATEDLPELLSSNIKHNLNASNSKDTNLETNENNPSSSMTHTNIIQLEPIYLQHGYQISCPLPASVEEQKPSLKRQKVTIDTASLTDDEKRTNHIISEQKRRNAIRSGFKELTDMIPTLKNINNSKSTILFKAVEFMKHLDKRNRVLSDKVKSLQIKLQVQGRIQKSDSQQRKQGYHPMLPPDTISALIAHKNQQKQLEQLQNQLRIQHQLLRQHNIISPFQQDYQEQKTYHSIFIPSSRSSESDEIERWSSN